MYLKTINLETAKLLKEKGFNEIVSSYHVQEQVYPAPSLALLQKWLMEVHKLQVIPHRDVLGDVMDKDPFYFDNEKWICSIDDLNITTEGMAKMRGFEINKTPTQFKTHDEALERGLFDALNLI